MPDETKRVQATHGPYAGSQIDLESSDAEAAIADGWAIDPFATVDPKAEPKEWSQEAHDTATAAAAKAARKLRGEPEPDNPGEKDKKPEAKPAADSERRDSSETSGGSDTSGGYQTRRSTPARPKSKE